MTKKYNRKRLLEENSTDNSPSLKKVNFEKSNRQESKKEIKQEIEEFSKKELSKSDRSDLIWEVEMKLAMDCEMKNIERSKKGLPEECNCPLPERLTDEQLYAILDGKEVLIVNDEDFDQIIEEIENPSEPNEKLRKLLKDKPTDN